MNLCIGRRLLHLEFRDICKGKRNIVRKKRMAPGPVETLIRTKITEQLKPVHLEVINESYMHNVPDDAEQHFKVIVVSDLFNGKSLLQQHQMVNSALANELKTKIHALSIVAKTPVQWKDSQEISKSPACLGGFGK